MPIVKSMRSQRSCSNSSSRKRAVGARRWMNKRLDRKRRWPAFRQNIVMRRRCPEASSEPRIRRSPPSHGARLGKPGAYAMMDKPKARDDLIGEDFREPLAPVLRFAPLGFLQKLRPRVEALSGQCRESQAATRQFTLTLHSALPEACLLATFPTRSGNDPHFYRIFHQSSSQTLDSQG